MSSKDVEYVGTKLNLYTKADVAESSGEWQCVRTSVTEVTPIRTGFYAQKMVQAAQSMRQHLKYRLHDLCVFRMI